MKYFWQPCRGAVRSKSGSCNLPTNTLGNLQILDRRDYVCTKFHCCPSTFPKRWFLRPKFCILNKKLRTKIFPQFVESPKFRGGIGGVMTPLLLASWHWPILKQQFTTDPSANSKINSTIMSHSVMARIEPTQPFEYKITSIPGQSIFKHFQVPFPELSLWYFTTSS